MATQTDRRFYSIDAVKAANADRGHHFFEPATMRFFRSRVAPRVFNGTAPGTFFVTSEQFVDSRGNAAARRYSVRRIDADGVVHSYGEFQEHDTLRAAYRAAERAANGEPCPCGETH